MEPVAGLYIGMAICLLGVGILAGNYLAQAGLFNDASSTFLAELLILVGVAVSYGSRLLSSDSSDHDRE